jgi:hypothetical protein
MNIVIFSKDRAAQLDLLIQSIYKFVFDPNIFVIYKHSEKKYQAAYDILFKKYIDVIFIREICIKDELIDLTYSLDGATCLCTDDSVFFRELPNINYEQLLIDNDCNSFSTRSGLNTSQQCHWKPIFQKPINNLSTDVNFLKWKWAEHDYSTDYGRPMSIDGNIFLSSKLYKILKETTWDNPRNLDAIMHADFGEYIMSCNHSVLTCIPWNLVAPGYADNYGLFHKHHQSDINNNYLNGQTIQLDKLDFSNVYSSHIEIPLIME